MAIAALSVIPVTYVTETVTVDMCAATLTPSSQDPLTTSVSSQTFTHKSPIPTTQVELSTDQSSSSPQPAASMASSESLASSDAGAILTNTPPSSIPQAQPTGQVSTVTSTPYSTPSATALTSQVFISNPLTAVTSVGSSTQAHQSNQPEPAVTTTSTSMPPATESATPPVSCTSTSGQWYCIEQFWTDSTATVTASNLPTSTVYVTPVAETESFTSSNSCTSMHGPHCVEIDLTTVGATATATEMETYTVAATEPATSSNSCTSWSGPYCVELDLTTLGATATATEMETYTVAASTLSTSTIYVTPRSISSPSTEGFAPTALPSLSTTLSSASGQNLPRDGPRESAVKASNKGFAAGESGHNDTHGPMVPYFFIPVLIVAVVFSLMIERRVRRVVNGVMGNIAMERRRARRL